MSSPEPARRARHGTRRDAALVLSQARYEQLAFWRNPVGAIFTLGFSMLFLALLAAGSGTSTSSAIPGVRLIQYYVPGFAAYGVMSASFNNLAISLVNRRETGLLKRMRLSPLPTPVFFGGLFVSTLVVCAIQVVLLLVLGRFAFHVVLPSDLGALVVALGLGVICFSAIGIAASSLVPNQDSAGPVVSIVYFVLLFLSGLWFPLSPGSGLAKVSAYFPIRHFIVAVFAPFDPRRGASPWAWHDLEVLAIWGVASVLVALRRFSFEPHRPR